MHKCARARGIFRSVKGDAPNLGTTRTGGWAGRWRRRETCDSIDVYCHRSGFGWICARTQQMAVLKRRWRSGRTYSKAPLRIIYVLQLNSNEFVLLFEQHVCCVGEYVSFSPIVCVCVFLLTNHACASAQLLRTAMRISVAHQRQPKQRANPN